ncbi:MAG: OmpA family protein [Bacteroidales bacterium]|jgi:outer membrane protein OmpA-like peptidoglycan-associated protein/Tol biopolymer transport system component|nr:OmpA family protein [Bacteroidales bacterium]MDD4214856.1 OmpA family protein [Bacteroidales bacterium]
MLKIKTLFLLLCIIFCAAMVSGQINYTTKNSKAIKLFDKAMEYFQQKDYMYCESSLLKAIKEDEYFIEAHMLLGQIYDEQKKYEQAIISYNKVIEIDPDFFSGIYFNVADIQFSLGKYEDARTNLEKYLSYDKLEPRVSQKATFLLKCCEFAIYAIKNPVPFNPVNLGDSVNSTNNEYSPSLTVDEQTLVITVLRPSDQYTIHSFDKEEDFYMSTKLPDGTWTMSRRMGSPLNSHGNEGAQTISPDGKTLYFTICNRSDGMGSCDLYVSERKGNTWTNPQNMGVRVNSSTWDSQPSISPDGKTLYFASARQGGKGSMDIWKTKRDENGVWSSPVNLGDSINTPQSEMSPFIHSDGKTLYFTSTGHPGMGGLDIFYSKMDEKGIWSKPKNIGYPINTYNDEGYLIVNAKGDKAYFSSDKLGGVGGMDIYSFDLYEEARPTAVTYMKGIVYDAKTKKRLQAQFELTDLTTSEDIVQSASDAVTGEFLVSVPTNRNYALSVSKEGYLFYSENFELKGDHSKLKPFIKDIYLQPIETGGVVVLKNIFFDFDKFDLKPESQVELNRLVGLLNQNKSMKIEIGGHTDNKGSAEYNQKLSENRARSVYEFLIAKGIDKTRLSYKGYGLTHPIDTNDTDEGRANNRRTEFKVISK